MTSPTEPVHRHTLANGLLVCVVERHSLPMAAVNLTYRVGSRDESDGLRGFAHLFEHLMFQGSEHVRAGEHSATLSRYGANPNATTSFDRTNYFQTVEIGALELALWFEADRMGGMLAALDQAVLDNEREVVKNERRERMDNQPYGTGSEVLFAALFPAGHPYHYLPIGLMADIDAATLADTRAFFSAHYAPDNAVLTIVGDVTAEAAFALAEKYFGGIGAHGALAGSPATPIVTHQGPRRIEMPEPMPAPAVFSGFVIPGQAHADFAAVRLACAVLADGPASRLGRRAQRVEQVAQDCYAGAERLNGDCAVAMIELVGFDEADPAYLEQLCDEEIQRLAAEGPTEEELDRVRALGERQLWEALATVEGMADFIGESEAFRPGRDAVADRLAELEQVDAAAVRRVAARWLAPQNRITAHYRGGAEPADGDAVADDQFVENRVEMAR